MCCLSTVAIFRQPSILRNLICPLVMRLKSGIRADSLLASFKYFGHWIGDIHQPLHVSFADDRGGNFIRESGPCVNSLHTVWDTCIIEKKLGTDPQTIAQDLLDGLPDSDRAAWVAVPIAGWANESFQVTRRKSVQYCVRVGTKCVYQQGNETFSEGEAEEVVIVNAAYLELHVPVVRDRLERAGYSVGPLAEHNTGAVEMAATVDGS